MNQTVLGLTAYASTTAAEGGEQTTGSNLAIHKQWQEYVGADRIAILNDPNRIVDVTSGLWRTRPARRNLSRKRSTSPDA